MKRYTVFAAALTLAVCAPALAGGDGWLTDMDAATAQAVKEKKDLLLDFTGSDWCHWCIKLNEEIFDQDAFKAGTKDTFVLVELDFPRRKQVEPKLKEQNIALRKKMDIRGYPMVVLCDARVRPYAITGYRACGPEKYVKSLDALQALRMKRDQAFADADKATNDVEKAKCLIAGLKTMDENIVEAYYTDIVERIGQLDKVGETGFVKAFKATVEKKETAQKQQALIQAFCSTNTALFFKAREFDKALAGMKTCLKENASATEDYKAGMLLSIGMTCARGKKDVAAAMAVMDEIVKTYPESGVARDADMIRQQYKNEIGSLMEVPAKADTH